MILLDARHLVNEVNDDIELRCGRKSNGRGSAPPAEKNATRRVNDDFEIVPTINSVLWRLSISHIEADL